MFIFFNNTPMILRASNLLVFIFLSKCPLIRMFHGEDLESLVVQPNDGEKAVVIFLHGASTTGPIMCDQILSIDAKFFLPRVTYIFPTSLNRTVNGTVKRAWFDRPRLALDESELFDTIDPPCRHVHQIVQNEILRGIKASRIFVGGYSMGGALAFFYAYRYLILHDPCVKIGGAFVLSGFLNSESKVYQTMDQAKALNFRFPDLFQAHGRLDDVVDFEWALDTLDKLKARGVQVDFHMFEKQDHDPTEPELEALKMWINKKLN